MMESRQSINGFPEIGLSIWDLNPRTKNPGIVNDNDSGRNSPGIWELRTPAKIPEDLLRKSQFKTTYLLLITKHKLQFLLS